MYNKTDKTLTSLLWPKQLDEVSKNSPGRASYNLSKISSIVQIKNTYNKYVPNVEGEIILFSIMRNESLRLPYFISYYKKLGVDRFVLIDNNSSDNTIEIASSYENVHIFSTNESYKKHWNWMEYFLSKYGHGHWCVIVDIDELLIYPNADTIGLKKLSEHLDEKLYEGLKCILLDMYAKSSIDQATYKQGDNPLDTLEYFDSEYKKVNFRFFDKYAWKSFGFESFTGGVRTRVFGDCYPNHILSKTPFIKYRRNMYLAQGMHASNRCEFSCLQGAVLHTKFLFDFLEEVEQECERQQHAGNAFYYKQYKKYIDNNLRLNFYGKESIKFNNLSQLVTLGVMKSSTNFDRLANGIRQRYV